MRARTRLAALAAAVALPLALGCGSGSPTKPADNPDMGKKMQEMMEKQMKDRKAAMTAPTGKE